MTPRDPGRMRQLGSLGGFTSASKRTPEERSEAARKAGLASGEARRAGKAEQRESVRRKPMPTERELEPYIALIRAEEAAAGTEPLSYAVLLREAALRLRRDVAAAAVAALKGRDAK